MKLQKTLISISIMISSKWRTFGVILAIIAVLVFRALSIPPFDPPDEQSHYAQIHFFVNQGRMPNLSDSLNLSAEEVFAERIIGTMSDGENKYFFHPEYSYEMTDSTVGKYEYELVLANTKENRSSYIAKQSSTYPPLYYLVGSGFYKLVNDSSFFTRLYAVRFESLLFTLLVPIAAYYFGMMVWGTRSESRALAFMVLAFPMTTYLGVGINSDNLHFLLFGILMALLVGIIRSGFSVRKCILVGIVVGLDLITKPQGYICFPLILTAFIIRWEKMPILVLLKRGFYILAPILLLAGWQELPKFILGSDISQTTAYVAREINFGGLANLQTYLQYYIRTHSAEIIVWYWGVFKWSGIILPPIFWQVANRLVLLAGLGILISWYKEIRTKKFSLVSRAQLFSIISIIIYVASIAAFDWQFYQEYGRSLGLQARYYLPLLVPQLFLLISGLLSFGWSKNVKKMIIALIIIFFLIMHLVSVYIQLASYYDLSSASTFINEVSQYKPLLGKGNWWLLWTPLYFTGIIYLTIWALNLWQKKNK